MKGRTEVMVTRHDTICGPKSAPAARKEAGPSDGETHNTQLKLKTSPQCLLLLPLCESLPVLRDSVRAKSEPVPFYACFSLIPRVILQTTQQSALYSLYALTRREGGEKKNNTFGWFHLESVT